LADGMSGYAMNRSRAPDRSQYRRIIAFSKTFALEEAAAKLEALDGCNGGFAITHAALIEFGGARVSGVIFER